MGLGWNEHSHSPEPSQKTQPTSVNNAIFLQIKVSDRSLSLPLFISSLPPSSYSVNILHKVQNHLLPFQFHCHCVQHSAPLPLAWRYRHSYRGRYRYRYRYFIEIQIQLPGYLSKFQFLPTSIHSDQLLYTLTFLYFPIPFPKMRNPLVYRNYQSNNIIRKTKCDSIWDPFL